MLTYIQINAAKPREKAWTLSDSQSLYLVIQPNGSKLWRFNYRFLDKQKKLHLGGWPTISLAEARVRRDEAKKKIVEGIDPALEKKRARIAAKYAAANTFEAVAEEWLVKCERDGLAPVTIDKIRWLLAKAYPLIGTIPIAQITPHEALAVLRKVEATGAYESARRMRSVLSRVFRYGVATVRCDKDVAADLRGAIAAPKVKHFAAITKPSEVGKLLRAIDGYSGHKVTIMAMRLSPHVLLRPGELRQAEWTDIDFDEAIWFIPAERMKMRRPHRVPLSRQVIAMLKELHEHTHWWKYLFPCLGEPRRHRRVGDRARHHRKLSPAHPAAQRPCDRAAGTRHLCAVRAQLRPNRADRPGHAQAALLPPVCTRQPAVRTRPRPCRTGAVWVVRPGRAGAHRRRPRRARSRRFRRRISARCRARLDG